MRRDLVRACKSCPLRTQLERCPGCGGETVSPVPRVRARRYVVLPDLLALLAYLLLAVGAGIVGVVAPLAWETVVIDPFGLWLVSYAVAIPLSVRALRPGATAGIWQTPIFAVWGQEEAKKTLERRAGARRLRVRWGRWAPREIGLYRAWRRSTSTSKRAPPKIGCAGPSWVSSTSSRCSSDRRRAPSISPGSR